MSGQQQCRALTDTQQHRVNLARQWLAEYRSPRPVRETTDDLHARIAGSCGAAAVTIELLLEVIEQLTGGES